jgi:hypothetical protein
MTIESSPSNVEANVLIEFSRWHGYAFAHGKKP